MKIILDYIEQKRQEYSKLPFFDYLRDESVQPLQKLAFAPCAAPFIMSFGDLNKYAFRDERNPDTLQSIINKHTYQDDHHWLWFLEDLEKLGLNPILSFRDSLSLLWSEETEPARRLVHELFQLTSQASPLQRLVVIESIEATGNTFFTLSSAFIHDLEVSNNVNYRYFGNFHLKVESGRTHCDVEEQDYIDSIQCTETERIEQKRIVDQVFKGFTAFTNELLSYAQKHPVTSVSTQPPIRLGTCLVDAGLINQDQLDCAIEAQHSKKMRIGEILAENGWIDQQTVEYIAENIIPLQKMNIPSTRRMRTSTPRSHLSNKASVQSLSSEGVALVVSGGKSKV